MYRLLVAEVGVKLELLEKRKKRWVRRKAPRPQPSVVRVISPPVTGRQLDAPRLMRGTATPPIVELGAGNDHLKLARFLPPATIVLDFPDARFSLPIELLEMPVERIRWRTAQASTTGDAMTVRGIRGDLITIDVGTLRYLVDPAYAAKTDAALKALQFTRDELKELANDNPAPPDWFSEPGRDLRRESWK